VNLALLAISVVLAGKVAIFDRRPQKAAFAFALLSIPLFLGYYADRLWTAGLRRLVEWPLDGFAGADTAFNSNVAPALIAVGLQSIQLIVLQRIAVRERLSRVRDPIATFIGSTTAATLAGGVVVSTFHWGWVGAVLTGVIYVLIYLGSLAVLAALLEIAVELAKLIAVWLKRKGFQFATWVTRLASWSSSLTGRLVTNTALDRIRLETSAQESVFLDEQDQQDKALLEAYIRDQARRRKPIPEPAPLRGSLELTVPRTPLAKLGEVGSLDGFVNTQTSERVQYLIENSTSVAIGVSGPRGAGKTSLLRLFGHLRHDTRTAAGRHLGVLVSAPTVYDRREFLIYLFQRLCLTISSKGATGEVPMRFRRSGRSVAWAALTVMSIAALVAGVAWPWPLTMWKAIVGHPQQVAVTMGIAGLAVSAGVLLTRRIRTQLRRRRQGDVAALAERYYRELSYQETHTWTVAGGIKAAIGEFGSTGSLQRTQQQLSYPQLIDMFSRFLREASATTGKSHLGATKLVICIDELDRVSPAEAAVNLIHDIKGVFNVEGCAFLVSISEEALNLFERRIEAMRGTLDSVFDTTIEVGAFSLVQTREFLAKKFGSLPEPYVWLCHCLSGGIARELNRTVRRLHTLRSERGLEMVPELALAALRDDLAQIIPAQRDRDEAFRRVRSDEPGLEYLDAIVFWTTVVTTLFHDEPDRLVEVMRDDDTDTSPIERLARARRTISRWSRADRDEVGRIVADLGIDRPLGESLVSAARP
jgi:hypothetical protein